MALPNAGDLLAGRFRLLGVLGSGGSGIVWAAHDEKLGQRVAIKLIYPHLLNEMTGARLRREVTAARQPHPHAVTVYDLHEADGLGFLSMELVEGPTLRQRLQDRGRLDPPEVTAIGRQVAAALAHLHASGLVHRDVKPGNILLSRAGAGAARTSRSGLASGVNVLRPDPAGDHRPGETVVVKLCDLGLVRPLAAGSTLTESSMVVGTPAYMAPEQGIGADLTGRTDVYALGITLYECLTGQVPLQGESAVATLVQRQKTHVPRVRTLCPGCPPLLDRLLDRMLDPDPRRRPAAAEVERTLASGHLRFRLPVKQLVTLAAAAALVATGWLGWSWLRTPRTARVEAMGREVRGLDDRGTTTWSYQLENPVRQVEHADLDGDGREETLVATWPDDQPGVRMGQLPLSEFVAVTQAGRVVARIRPEELITSWRHQFAKRLVPEIRVLDLDGAGGTEVVLNCRHRAFFPDQLLVLWPSSGRWDWVLDHAGWIYDIERADSSGELIFLAVNNRLGMLPFVGRIGIEPPGSPARLQMSPGVMLLADDSLGRQSKAASWMLYVPLPQRLPGVRAGETNSVVLTPGGSVKVSIFGDAWQLDGHGNLTVGPNGGRDLREERLTLFDELSLLSAFRQPMGWAAIREAERRLQVRCRLVLQEPPYQAIAALAVAGAYARADRQQDAVQVLSAALQVVPYEDLAYRLASLLALSGRLAEAGEKALQLAEKPLTQRASYDAPMLILRLGIARHDEALVTRAIDLLRGRHATDTWQPRLAPSLWADARLWWDRARTSDSMVTSSPYAPDGDAVACLVRWRLGMTRQDDAAAMARLVDDSPDAAPAGRLALAAAQIATSRLPEALATLDRVILDLAPAARVDFASYQFQGLARAMEAKARLLSGEKAAAKALARALLPQFDRGLLPSVLCREVLAAE